MKKVLSFFSFAVLVTAMCVMSGCKDDDKDDDKGGSSNAKALVGRWLKTQSRDADKTEWSDWTSPLTGALQFDEDGTYSALVGGLMLGTGTYVVEGKKIIITFSDNTTQTCEIREMSKDKNYMEILFYKSDGKTPNVYSRYLRCPKDAAEAKQLILSQWKWDVPEGEFDDATYDAYYKDFSKEGKQYEVYHCRKDLTPDNYVYDYRGKYICWDNEIYDVEFTPDKTDPTKVEGSWVYKTSTGTYTINRLSYQRMLWGEEQVPYIRVEKPFTFEIIESPEVER